MIIVSGKAKFKPGAIAGLRDLMEATITETRKEDGCIDYSYGVDVLDPDAIVVVEYWEDYWEDWAALEKHFTQAHMAVWIKALGEAGLVSRDIKFIEAGEERDLFG